MTMVGPESDLLGFLARSEGLFVAWPTFIVPREQQARILGARSSPQSDHSVDMSPNRFKCTLTAGSDKAPKDPEAKGKYARFWKEYGKAIKLGLIEDSSNRGRLAKLLRVHT